MVDVWFQSWLLTSLAGLWVFLRRSLALLWAALGCSIGSLPLADP
jgi:hypothetical protein